MTYKSVQSSFYLLFSFAIEHGILFCFFLLVLNTVHRFFFTSLKIEPKMSRIIKASGE